MSKVRPAIGRTLMDSALLWADRSTCSRNYVGTVIALEGRIIGTGYNGAPAGMPHCRHRCNCPPTVPQASFQGHAGNCSAMKPCKESVHAEANAIAFCAKHGLATGGADLYTTLGPCYVCAQLIVNSGIKRVIYRQKYRDKSGLELLDRAGVVLAQEWM